MNISSSENSSSEPEKIISEVNVSLIIDRDYNSAINLANYIK